MGFLSNWITGKFDTYFNGGYPPSIFRPWPTQKPIREQPQIREEIDNAADWLAFRRDMSGSSLGHPRGCKCFWCSR